MRNRTIKRASTLSSRDFRVNSASYDLICIYKAGLVLDPGEVHSWALKIKKLSSSRHKNILLRVAHGDIFSNRRLHNFGLTDLPGCKNCPEPIETNSHHLFECPKAHLAWRELEDIKIQAGLTPLTDLTLESIMGVKDNIGKIELALQAELLHRLASTSQPYEPHTIVKAAVKFVNTCEQIHATSKQS